MDLLYLEIPLLLLMVLLMQLFAVALLLLRQLPVVLLLLMESLVALLLLALTLLYKDWRCTGWQIIEATSEHFSLAKMKFKPSPQVITSLQIHPNFENSVTMGDHRVNWECQFVLVYAVSMI